MQAPRGTEYKGNKDSSPLQSHGEGTDTGTRPSSPQLYFPGKNQCQTRSKQHLRLCSLSKSIPGGDVNQEGPRGAMRAGMSPSVRQRSVYQDAAQLSRRYIWKSLIWPHLRLRFVPWLEVKEVVRHWGSMIQSSACSLRAAGNNGRKPRGARPSQAPSHPHLQRARLEHTPAYHTTGHSAKDRKGLSEATIMLAISEGTSSVFRMFHHRL